METTKVALSMAEARVDKWKAMKKKSFLQIPPDTDCLRQQFIAANYLTYLVLHPLLKKHLSPIGHGWELVDGNCHPVRHTRPALPAHLPTLHLETAEKREETNMRRLMKSKKKEKKIQSKVKKNGLI